MTNLQSSKDFYNHREMFQWSYFEVNHSKTDLPLSDIHPLQTVWGIRKFNFLKMESLKKFL